MVASAIDEPLARAVKGEGAVLGRFLKPGLKVPAHGALVTRLAPTAEPADTVRLWLEIDGEEVLLGEWSGLLPKSALALSLDRWEGARLGELRAEGLTSEDLVGAPRLLPLLPTP